MGDTNSAYIAARDVGPHKSAAAYAALLNFVCGEDGA